jgi:hypothetical protein
MRNKSRSKDYQVGYGRPPAAFRFLKGVSGNPEGKRKRAKAPNLASQLQGALNKPATIAARLGSSAIYAANRRSAALRSTAGPAGGPPSSPPNRAMPIVHSDRHWIKT